MNLVSWNKRHGDVVNNLDRIKAVIIQTQATVLLVNEFNFTKNEDIRLIQVEGYKIELDALYKCGKKARSALYIKDNIRYKRKRKYEINIDSSICIEMGFPRQKKIIYYGHYRQWKLLDDPTTISWPSQLQRFTNTINKWEEIINLGKEVHIQGDMNLDILLLDMKEIDKKPYQKNQAKMLNLYKQKILDRNMHILNKKTY